MATLLQSPPTALSLADVALISQQLAEELGHLVFKTEGFSVEDYLSLDGNYIVEYADGCLQVLPMPNALHQAIVFVLATLLGEFSESDPDARTNFAPFKVRLDDRQWREPDICFMKGENARRRTNDYWIGADLVIEVIIESNRDHDFETKVREYAKAGIPEYWIVDPALHVIFIFVLNGSVYEQPRSFGLGQVAASHCLEGFSVDVTSFFKKAHARA